MLPAEIMKMRKLILTISLTKPRYNAEEILRTYERLNYGDMHY
jgi:hypothetical protein